MPRDYKREYSLFHSKPEEKKRRAQRNRSRRMLQALGRVSKGDGKDVHHRNHRPEDQSKGNLSVLSKSQNRKKNKRGR
jgi:hypothetical protein